MNNPYSLNDLQANIKAELGSRWVSKRRLLVMLAEMAQALDDILAEQEREALRKMMGSHGTKTFAVPTTAFENMMKAVQQEKEADAESEAKDDYRSGHYLAYL